MDLFEEQRAPAPNHSSPQPALTAPLAERMRPQQWQHYIGQSEIAGAQGVLRQLIEAQSLSSLILWGPPGTGKTTLALMIAQYLQCRFVSLSAVSVGVKELREQLEEADKRRRRFNEQCVLFIDEIHRFHKGQQDVLLPYVERGSVILIGATTENPSFELNSALLSRARVFVLKPLEIDDLVAIMRRALSEDLQLKEKEVMLSAAHLHYIAVQAVGDARRALNSLEFIAATGIASRSKSASLSEADLQQAIAQSVIYHDKSGAQHYDTISALHKSMRNSDPDATLYWLGRMLEAGDDPLYIARRLVRFASEDIGLADSRALSLAIAAKEAADFLGMPECELALAQAALFMALAPKNNSVYRSYGKVKASLKAGEVYPVPHHLRNAVTEFDTAQGFGAGYEYAHDTSAGISAIDCLPEKLAKDGRGKYYEPKKIGSEAQLIHEWLQRRAKMPSSQDQGEKKDEI